jgi:hypothetical protein
MKPLSSYIGEELTLVQPSFFKREYEFRSSKEILAKMYYPKFFSFTVVAEGFNKKYEIFRPNFWKSQIAIREFGNELCFATLTTNFFRTRGTIDLQNGKKVLLKFGTFKRACDIFSESLELLVSIQTKFSFKDKNVVTIQKSSSVIDENPWMIMMICYFLIESKKNGAAAA